MEAIKDGTHLCEVERRAEHAAWPGFRITEIQLSKTQKVPWHYHNNVQDTFYVLNGNLRLFLRDPKEEIRLAPGDTYSVKPRRRTSSPMAGRVQRLSSCCRASVNTTLFRSSSVLLALLGALLLSRAALAQQQKPQAPGFPDAPGKETLLAKCFQCHSAGMWLEHRQDRRAWAR